MSENEDLKNKENNKNSNEESDKIAVTEEEIHSSGQDGHELGNDQKPKKRGVSWLVYILTILIVGGGTFVGTSYVLTGRLPGQSVITGSSGTALATSEIQKIQAAFSTIVGDYVEDVDRDAVVDGAISGMTQVLEDPYSQYLTDQSAQQLDETIEGSFEGIGAEIMEKDDYIQIVSPIKGSPAEEAGLMANDIIIAVNGESIQGYTATEAVALIRGEAGSDVVLTIQRGEDTFDVTVTRDTVPIQTVYYEILEGQDNTGYVQITSFSTPTYDELVAAIEDLRLQGAEKFVLDVRSNPGGLLTSALQIANMFLNDGDTIMQVQEKDADPYVYEASDADYGDFQVDEDVVLLVDEGSASASEILAAALQESAGIPVVGSQTFGKGTVQNVFSLESDSELKITIAKWLTPNGTWINETGVTPDVEASLPDYASLTLIDTSQTYQEGDVSEAIQNIEAILVALGYQDSEADAVFAEDTTSAVLAFQADQGLAETGVIDTETASAMISAIQALIASNDTQLDKAVEVLE